MVRRNSRGIVESMYYERKGWKIMKIQEIGGGE